MARSQVLTEKYLMDQMKQSVPYLSNDAHKGQAGRIGVFGGSLEYTGAPYFSSISALRCGCDLVHVFCRKEAAPVIKCYSPELIVHSLLDVPDAVVSMAGWLDRLHAVVLGPGLGRDECVFKILPDILGKIKEKGIPLVIDADGLFYINKKYEDIQGCLNVVLTPNMMEFSRLYEAVMGSSVDLINPEHVKSLAMKMGNVTILCKGKFDIISNGIDTVICREVQGSPRRCGGQGDLLSGMLATLLHWTTCDTRAQFPTLSAACAASVLTKTVNRKAFDVHGRGTLATDMIPFIASSFRELIGHA